MAARWHEGPADATLLTPFRGWASALLSLSAPKSSYIQSRPGAVSRWRVTLGKRVPAVSRETLRADGPVH